jgi:hypothetical protein
MRLAGVRNRLGNPKPFFSDGTALGEHPQVSVAPGEVGTEEYSGQEDQTEVLVTPCPFEGRHSLFVAVDRPTIVALGLVGSAEGEVR